MLFMSCCIRFLAIAGMQSFDSPVIRLPQICDVVAALELADVVCKLAETAEVAEVDDNLTIELAHRLSIRRAYGMVPRVEGAAFGPLTYRFGDRPARFGGSVCKMRARVMQDGGVMLVFEVICA